MSVKITNDLFDIANRLKEIDYNYFVVYNFFKKKFEVHYLNQNPTYCLTVPYECLDSRTVDLVLKTKAENSEKLYLEIDRHNEQLQKEGYKKILDNTLSLSGL